MQKNSIYLSLLILETACWGISLLFTKIIFISIGLSVIWVTIFKRPFSFKKISVKTTLSTLFSLSGILILHDPDPSLFSLESVFTIIAALLLSFYTLQNKKQSKKPYLLSVKIVILIIFIFLNLLFYLHNEHLVFRLLMAEIFIATAILLPENHFIKKSVRAGDFSEFD